LAAAFTARQLNTPISVVIPLSTPLMMIDKIKDQKATVIQHGKDWQEADNHARTLCESRHACYVPPFDHPLIWEGNATLIHEVAKTNLKPDAVVISVGGGGLFCGVVQGMHDVGWIDVPIYAAETTGAASFAAAIKAGKIVKIDTIDTIATSLGARAVTQEAIKWAKIHPVYSKVVSDFSAITACQRFAEDHRILVEPACGATLSLCYDLDNDLKIHKNILVVVCGGACVTPALLTNWFLESKSN
jgi:L-serine/L-threonine ammonia-lyase